MGEIQNRRQLGIRIFLLYLIGCIGGWLYEIVFYQIDTGHFVKRGQGFGPWLPIYGFGTLAIMALMYRRKHSPGTVFLGSALTSGVIEFLTGWVLFHFGHGLRLWDYNTEIWNWGNIGGYVCFRSMLVFGLAGLLLVYIIIPGVFKMTSKVREPFLNAVAVPLTVVFVADFTIGYIIKPMISITKYLISYY